MAEGQLEKNQFKIKIFLRRLTKQKLTREMEMGKRVGAMTYSVKSHVSWAKIMKMPKEAHNFKFDPWPLTPGTRLRPLCLRLIALANGAFLINSSDIQTLGRPDIEAKWVVAFKLIEFGTQQLAKESTCTPLYKFSSVKISILDLSRRGNRDDCCWFSEFVNDCEISHNFAASRIDVGCQDFRLN